MYRLRNKKKKNLYALLTEGLTHLLGYELNLKLKTQMDFKIDMPSLFLCQSSLHF